MVQLEMRCKYIVCLGTHSQEDSRLGVSWTVEVSARKIDLLCSQVSFPKSPQHVDRE